MILKRRIVSCGMTAVAILSALITLATAAYATCCVSSGTACPVNISQCTQNDDSWYDTCYLSDGVTRQCCEVTPYHCSNGWCRSRTTAAMSKCVDDPM
jgi:hypothetical protein